MKLNNQYNRIFVFAAIVTSLIAYLFIYGFSGYVNDTLKQAIAGQMSKEIRRLILEGDLRQATLRAIDGTASAFDKIELVDPQGRLLIKAPPFDLTDSVGPAGSVDHGPISLFLSKTLKIDLSLNDEVKMGEIRYFYSQKSILTKSFIASLPLFGLIFLTFYFLRKKLMEWQKNEIEAKNNASIANITQSISHDVRKPFSMIQMIADAVDATEDPIEAKEIMSQSIPEIQQAIASVNGILADVLEMGGASNPVTENTNPETLIEATLNQIFRVYPDSKVMIDCEFTHQKMVTVDTTKVLRVFANIIGNAVQAMEFKGTLWFRTRELNKNGKNFVEFCLGNGGSFIPAANLSKLFDSFYTSGKKGGTGLGLAIAQKVVRAHGGEIWCESSADGGKNKAKGGSVEFYFTLPAADQNSEIRQFDIPKSSEDIIQSFAKLRDASQGKLKSENNTFDASLEKEIIKISSQLGTKSILLFVDDEPLYRNSLARLVNQSDELAKYFEIHLAASASEEKALVAKFQPLAIVQDIDLGAGQINGYEVIKSLRAEAFKGAICVHSNRSAAEDYKTALNAGADSILPKPMSRSHLLNFLLGALKANGAISKQNLAEPGLPEFAVVDDSKIVLMSWKMKSKGTALVHTFKGPDDFFATVESDSQFLTRLKFVVTDFHFAEGVSENGLMFGARVKKVFDKPVLMSSNADFSADEIKGCVDQVISKIAQDYDEIVKGLMT